MSDNYELDQIARAARGERAAQAALVQHNMPIIYRVAFRMLGDASEAEDVTQETFLRAWKVLPRWKADAKFSTWACTVALNICRDRLRKKRPILMQSLPEEIDHALRPEDQVMSQQALGQIERQLGALPDRQREAISLCALEGFSNGEAAEAMGVSVRALESLLARARRTLRTHLLEREVQP